MTFGDYFRELHATFDAPPLNNFTARCLERIEDLAMRGGKRHG